MPRSYTEAEIRRMIDDELDSAENWLAGARAILEGRRTGADWRDLETALTCASNKALATRQIVKRFGLQGRVLRVIAPIAPAEDGKNG